MTLTHTTGKPLEEVQPFLLVSSADDVDRPYWELETEYRDPKTGRWKAFHDAEPDDLFGFFAVGPRSARTLQLRTRAVKNAKPGAGYALAAGDHRNRRLLWFGQGSLVRLHHPPRGREADAAPHHQAG
ncbi:hypothetical protein [Streptomyces sp. TM32]|uniref:hypothetical protein n=1 Tax=Streptomyces sp. TM32 TaxID=1652669 RepID=UPI0020B13CAB|nr:hypothetical protein [Streptomyces sp. TM32]